MLKCDLWGNITYYEDVVDGKNEWVKQKFVGENLINYEDSNGNYWENNWGECTLPILVVESTRMLSSAGYSDIDYNTSEKNCYIQNWGISNPIIKSDKNVIYLGPSPTLTFSSYTMTDGGDNCTYGTIGGGFSSTIDVSPTTDYTIVSGNSNTSIITLSTDNSLSYTYDGTITIGSGDTNSNVYSTISGGYNNYIIGTDCYGYTSKAKSHYYDKSFYYNGGLTVKEVNDE